MSTIADFAAAVKARLRKNVDRDLVDVDVYVGSTQTGACIDGVTIDWSELDRQIDELAAEFAARQAAAVASTG